MPLIDIFHFAPLAPAVSDGELAADEEEDDDTDLPGLPDEDQWHCTTCSYSSNHAMNRHCMQCWTLRPGWLAALERSSTAPAGLSGDSNLISDQTIQRFATVGPTLTVEEIPSTPLSPSHLRSAPGPIRNERTQSLRITPYSRTQTNSLETSAPSTTSISITESHSISTPTSSIANTSRWNVEDSEDENPLPPEDRCVICVSKPRNASIIHGQTGHQVCCFDCASKLREKKKRCPICRSKIQMVIKNFL